MRDPAEAGKNTMKRTKLNLNFSSLTSHPFDFAQDDPESYRMGHLSSRDGFTLIELLIVIVIIGILATIFFANYLGVRQRARDSQRKSNLRQIQAALELYRYGQGTYPVPGTYGLYPANCPTSGPLVGGTETYMKNIPCDSKGISYYNSGNYYYTSGGTSYTLCACLENIYDSQGAANSACSTGVSPACSSDEFFSLQSQ